MKYCASCGETALPTMVMCASCGHRNFSDLPTNNGSGENADANLQSSSNVSGAVRQPSGISKVIGPNIIPDGWLETPVTPWRRYGARILDITFFGALGFFLIGVIYFALAPYSADKFFAIFEEPSARVLDIIVSSLVGSLITGAIIGITGSSLGKVIFGIVVTDSNGNRIGLANGLQRDFTVFLRGLGLAIPIVSFFTLYSSYKRLTKNKATSWDEEKSYRVWHRPSGASQYALNTIGILLILLVNAGLNAM